MILENIAVLSPGSYGNISTVCPVSSISSSEWLDIVCRSINGEGEGYRHYHKYTKQAYTHIKVSIKKKKKTLPD